MDQWIFKKWYNKISLWKRKDKGNFRKWFKYLKIFFVNFYSADLGAAQKTFQWGEVRCWLSQVGNFLHASLRHHLADIIQNYSGLAANLFNPDCASRANFSQEVMANAHSFWTDAGMPRRNAILFFSLYTVQLQFQKGPPPPLHDYCTGRLQRARTLQADYITSVVRGGEDGKYLQYI